MDLEELAWGASTGPERLIGLSALTDFLGTGLVATLEIEEKAFGGLGWKTFRPPGAAAETSDLVLWLEKGSLVWVWGAEEGRLTDVRDTTDVALSGFSESLRCLSEEQLTASLSPISESL